MNINYVAAPYPVNLDDGYGCLDKLFVSLDFKSNLWNRINMCVYMTAHFLYFNQLPVVAA